METPIPIHPAIVHVPIVALILGAVFELIGRALDAAWWRKAATALLVIGALGAGAAFLTGRQAEEPAEDQGVPEEPIHAHEKAGTWTLVLAGAALLARILEARAGRRAGLVSGVALVLYIAAAASVGKTAYHGGVLVYHHGAGVKVEGKAAGGESRH